MGISEIPLFVPVTRSVSDDGVADSTKCLWRGTSNDLATDFFKVEDFVALAMEELSPLLLLCAPQSLMKSR